MATRTDNPVTLTAEEVEIVLSALNDAAAVNYKFWRNQKHQAATRAYAKQQADKAMQLRDAIISRMHTWK